VRRLLLAISIILSGCYGMADYRSAPRGALEYGSGSTPVDPDELRVASNSYPKYRVSEPVTPPRWRYDFDASKESDTPMLDILPSDEWLVTHRFQNLYLIQSESYTDRQCHFLAKMGPGNYGGHVGLFSSKCQSNSLYAIFIRADGQVSGGWKLLKNPKIVILRSDRRTHFVPSPERNKGWESIKFQILK